MDEFVEGGGLSSWRLGDEFTVGSGEPEDSLLLQIRRRVSEARAGGHGLSVSVEEMDKRGRYFIANGVAKVGIVALARLSGNEPQDNLTRMRELVRGRGLEAQYIVGSADILESAERQDIVGKVLVWREEELALEAVDKLVYDYCVQHAAPDANGSGHGPAPGGDTTG